MSVELSIVICTYRRPALLRGALESLCVQTLSPGRFEIIVVDNGGIDDARAVVESVRAAYPGHAMELVIEPVAGSSKARNAGIARAKGRYIGFTDDDAMPAASWCEMAMVLLEEPAAEGERVCVGGPIRPFYTTPRPAWFRDEYEVWDLGRAGHALQRGEALAGGNMVWRRETLAGLGNFAEDFGPRGFSFAAGEDTRLFETFHARGGRGVCWYDPDLVVKHWVAPNKMKTGFRVRRLIAQGSAHGRMLRERGPAAAMVHLLISLLAVPVHAVIALLRLVTFTSINQWIVEAWEGALRRSGVVLGLLGKNVAMRSAQEGAA